MEIYSSDGLDEDLESIKASCLAKGLRDDSYVILAFLEHLAESEDAMWALTKWDEYHGEFPKFNARAINCFQQAGFNLYRCRPYFKSLGNYRLIYAFDGINDEIHILAAVVKKPDDLPEQEIFEEYYGYEPNHPITKRICAEYDKIGLPKIS